LDTQKQRCRLSKFWRIMTEEEDGELHYHEKTSVVGNKNTVRCVLFCRLCFDPKGNVYDRDYFHN
jgi:hypothetical protein